MNINSVSALSENTLEWALKQFFFSANSKVVDPVSLRDKIKQSSKGTFGAALCKYYEENESLPFPGEKDSLFPADYLLLHDSHHVLIGADVSESGEVYVTAFECGLMSLHARILPLLSQIQVLLEHRKIDMFNANIAFQSFESGRTASLDLLNSFSPLDYLGHSLESIRGTLNINPIGKRWDV